MTIKTAILQRKDVFYILDLVQRWPFYELIPSSVQCQRYISATVRDTVDLSTPKLSPTTCRKLPDAKDLKAMRTCCSGSSAWPRWVSRTKSS